MTSHAVKPQESFCYFWAPHHLTSGEFSNISGYSGTCSLHTILEEYYTSSGLQTVQQPPTEPSHSGNNIPPPEIFSECGTTQNICNLWRKWENKESIILRTCEWCFRQLRFELIWGEFILLRLWTSTEKMPIKTVILSTLSNILI